MIEFSTDSLKSTINNLEIIKPKGSEDDWSGTSSTNDALKQKVAENLELLNLITQANDRKKALLAAMVKATQDELNDVFTRVGNIPVSSDAIFYLTANDWHIPLAQQEDPRLVTSQSTEGITTSLGAQSVDFHTGAVLRVETVRGIGDQPPVVQGTFKTHGGDYLSLKRLTLADERAKKMILQITEQRISAYIVQSALGGADAVNECIRKINEMKEQIRSDMAEGR